MERPRRFRIACIVALVLGLHVVALWFLLARSQVILRHPDLQGFEIVLIPRPPAPPQQLHSAEPKRKDFQRLTARRQPPAHPFLSQLAPPEQSDAIHASIDWANELNRAAQDATADTSAQAAKDFGFPHRPSAAVKAPQFEWDYAATHRVESIEAGGLLVNLNDHCVLVLFPLPFFACGVGNKAANGNLLKHMGDPAAREQNAAP